MASLPSDPNSAADPASAADISRMEELARQPIGGLPVSPAPVEPERAVPLKGTLGAGRRLQAEEQAVAPRPATSRCSIIWMGMDCFSEKQRHALEKRPHLWPWRDEDKATNLLGKMSHKCLSD